MPCAGKGHRDERRRGKEEGIEEEGLGSLPVKSFRAALTPLHISRLFNPASIRLHLRYITKAACGSLERAGIGLLFRRRAWEGSEDQDAEEKAGTSLVGHMGPE